jgi:membrane-bound inhibitor of C-type lysozyme
MLKPLTLAIALLPGAALAQSVWQDDGARVQTVAYTCATAMDDLSVAYFTAADGSSFAAVQIAGRVHAMVQEASASGARYVDIDAEAGYRIHTKGDSLMLLKRADDDSATEQVLADCTAFEG